MYKLKYIFILIITFVITSCSTDQVEIALGIADPIEVSVSETSVQDPVTRATLAGPVTYFETGDAIGIFVVDKSGNVVKSNVKYTYNGTSWNPESGAAITYSRDHKYYAYYPYTASVAGAPTSNTAYKDYPSADVVLKNLASNWTVQSDQSTKANYKKSDLMTAAYKGAGVDNNAVVFQMNHRMGLAIVSMSKKTVSGQKYEMKQDPSYTWTYGTATLTSSNKFTTRIPYTSSSKYYYIIKASTATTLSASNTMTTTSGSGNSWSTSVTISAGKYKAVSAPQPSIDASSTIVYEMKVGDVLFADGAMGRDASEYGSDRVPVALVFSTTTSTKDKALGYKHGYAMALHDLGKGTQVLWSDLTDNPTEHYLTTNDAATIKADMDGLTYNRKLTKRSNYSSIKSHYPAIELARTYNDKSSNVVSGASEWYLPSTGQWWTMLKNFASLSDTGYHSLADGSGDNGFYYESGADKVIKNFAAFLSSKGVSFDNLDNTGDKTYWTSSEFNSEHTWYLALWRTGEIYFHVIRFKRDSEKDLWRIRPVCAF